MARVQTSRRNCRRAVMVAPWVSSRRRRQIRYTLEARRFGEVAESAEGSRLLSGYRGKTSVPGSNPGLSAIRLSARGWLERRTTNQTQFGALSSWGLAFLGQANCYFLCSSVIPAAFAASSYFVTDSACL